METRTIAALSSARGTAAISIIRLSGPETFNVLAKCLRPAQEFLQCGPRLLGLYKLVSPFTEKPVDEVTAVKYKGPQSFTGENMAEVFCHGGQMVADNVLCAMVDAGAYPAERGEFTRRAFMNGKFDLLHAESILGIIESRSNSEYEASLEAYMGTGAKKLVEWRQNVREILEEVDAGIEFPEEDHIRASVKTKKERIEEIRKQIEMEIKNYENSHIVEKGIIIPIVGLSNAGKSSFFNMIVGFDRAIVHHKAGTTRDGVGEEIQIGKQTATLLDTAGFRETSDEVEMLGIQKTMEYIQRAAIIIWVTSADTNISSSEADLIENKAKGKIAAVISKTDLADDKEKKALCEKKGIPVVAGCLVDKGDRPEIVDFLARIVEAKIGAIETSVLVRTKRHEIIARQIVEELKKAEEAVAVGDEILSFELRNVLNDFGELIGETTNDDVLNNIFSRFCIGK